MTTEMMQDGNKNLGPLANLVGTWRGSQGLNVISVPTPGDSSTGPHFKILANPNYSEVLTFTAVDDAVRNRGGDLTQMVGAVKYQQEIFATDKKENMLHVENGMFLYLDNVTSNPRDEKEPLASSYSVARSATVPHGDSIMLLGTTDTHNGSPNIPDSSSVPSGFISNKMTNQIEKFHNVMVSGQTMDVSNPNEWLKKAIADQKISSTTSIKLDTKNQGGVTNIPFEVQHANTKEVASQFWLETVQNKDGTTTQQLQYSQTIIINFQGMDWPHITVNTLTKDTSTTPMKRRMVETELIN